MRTVQGVGINDAGYPVCPRVNGKIVWCPYYFVWSRMLARCYGKVTIKNQPTYRGCSVKEEWKLFSTFKGWMKSQEWEGLHLDKDILTPGNKIYGPETCVFVDRETNNLLLTSTKYSEKYAVGVSFKEGRDKFVAQYHKEGKNIHIGYFSTEEEAAGAYLKYKVLNIQRISELQKDSRVKEALLKKADEIARNLIVV